MQLKELYNRYFEGKIDKNSYIDLMHEKHLYLFDYYDYIKETDVQSIVIDNNEIYIVTKENNIKLLLDQNDKRFIPIEMLNFKSIEFHEKKVVFELVKNCKTIFDIGANIGWYTLNFGKLQNVEKIYAFEPIPYTFNFLKRHIKLNNIHNAEIFNIGLSDEIGEKEFFWTEEETGSSSMRNIRERSKINKVKCKLDTLDNFVKNRDIKIDFIKCDVEGAELFVFKGGIETIKKHKPIVFSEMLRKWSAKFDYNPNDIIRLFSDIGYKCYSIINNKLCEFDEMTDDVQETNFLFIHSESSL